MRWHQEYISTPAVGGCGRCRRWIGGRGLVIIDCIHNWSSKPKYIKMISLIAWYSLRPEINKCYVQTAQATFTGYTSIKHGSSRYVDTRSNLDACTWRMRVVSEVKYWWERAEDHCMLNWKSLTIHQHNILWWYVLTHNFTHFDRLYIKIIPMSIHIVLFILTKIIPMSIHIVLFFKPKLFQCLSTSCCFFSPKLFQCLATNTLPIVPENYSQRNYSGKLFLDVTSTSE